MSQITIAIADDHKMLRDSLCALLETLGYKILLSVEDGDLLLDSLKTTSEPPDVCILDVNMPGKNSHFITKELKHYWPGMKVIAFTVSRDKPWKKIMLDAGADFFLRKDAHPQLLHEVIQYLCKGQEAGLDQPAFA